ncbi:MAG: hypothetical protein RIK87_01290 [Fuerstiella sp.]
MSGVAQRLPEDRQELPVVTQYGSIRRSGFGLIKDGLPNTGQN